MHRIKEENLSNIEIPSGHSERFHTKKPTPASPAPNFLLNPRSISTEGKNGTQYSERLGAEPS